MRGRLISPFLAELCRLDTLATARNDPDGDGELTGGYDEDFKSPVLVDRDGDGIGERVRVEFPPVRLPCQVEPRVMDELRMFGTGNAPRSELNLVFHFQDLERLSLVDPNTGEALIHAGDRLAGLYQTSGQMVQIFRDPPGLFVTESRPIGFGLGWSNPNRNLLLVTFEDRQQASRRLA